jgi:dihydrofolate reductase
MGRVIFQTSMSLDGFMTAADQTAEEPLGRGGEQLHAWGFSADPRDRAYLERTPDHGGAVIAGRVTYEHSLPWWGADGPSGPARVPVFVVTHDAPAGSPDRGVYTFVTEGIESALRQAQEAAGERHVMIVGGASLGRAYIAAGLVDEIQIHIVPVLFGSGTRMFEDLRHGHMQLEPIEVVATPSATHIRYRVVR